MTRSKNTSNGTKGISFLDNLWSNIEIMPIYNWIKICETGDLRWLFIKGKGRVSDKIATHWISLQDEYLDEFGLDEKYKQQLRLEKEITGLNCDFVITRDRFLLNIIKMKEADIKATKTVEAFSFYQMKDPVEKYKGYRVDPLTTSVKEWYYSLKNMSDGQAN